ncbi:MAG: SGNH/GDSL hydrolase family protein [Aggregatilineales bacterium]
MKQVSKMTRRLALILFGVLLAWLLIEVVLRVGFELLPPGVQAQLQGVRRVPWAEERIVPAFPFILDRTIQVRLPVGLQNYPVRWSDARFQVDTISVWDGHAVGFRSAPAHYPLDVMTFGDSFTFCWTDYKDCWVTLLARRGGNWFNAAVPGTGTAGQFALMREIVPPTKPRLVIWTWFPNDLKDVYDLDLLQGKTEPLEVPPPLNPDLEPVGLGQFSALAHLIYAALTPPTILTPYQHYQTVFVNNRPLLVRTTEYPHADSLAWSANRYGLVRTLEIFDQARRFLREEIGAELLIVLLPTKEEAYSSALSQTLGNAYIESIGEGRRAIIAHLAANGYRYLDALPALRKAVEDGQSVFYSFDSHLDASGNRILAELVGKYLTRENLLPGQN